MSSQVGCAYDCKFCASGLAGFVRNLQPGEIVEQVLRVEAISGKTINNIVFMGMGEPLANLANVLQSISIINAHWGLGIGARHITVSTSGLAPQIKKLADYPLQVRLAISLHGASDEVRNRIMPINEKYNLERLFEALAYHRLRKKQKITFEYILIKGVNDSLEQARLLARRAKTIKAKVNLIPYNTVEGLPWKSPGRGTPGRVSRNPEKRRRPRHATARKRPRHQRRLRPTAPPRRSRLVAPRGRQATSGDLSDSIPTYLTKPSPPYLPAILGSPLLLPLPLL